MIVYRCVRERELANMLGIKNEVYGPRGENTFKYEHDKNYKHFFYHIDACNYFKESLNDETYYNKYALILAYDIDPNILKHHVGLGKYYVSAVRSNVNIDSVLRYFKILYNLEYAIPEELITNDMIVGIGDNTRITPVSYVGHDTMDHLVTKNQKNYLEYLKWLIRENMNIEKTRELQNIDRDIILSQKSELFPLDTKKYNKTK